MKPEIYTQNEIISIKSLMGRFRAIITNNERLYGFSLNEFDIVNNDFPNIDLYDESKIGVDHSYIVLNNMYAFLLDDKPESILNTKEKEMTNLLWEKLKNA